MSNKKKKGFRIKPASVHNRNRAIFFVFLSGISLVIFKMPLNIIVCAVSAGIAALNIVLTKKAKENEKILAEKIKASEKDYGEVLTEREKRFMSNFSKSDEDTENQVASWVANRIAKMEAEDEYYDRLEAEDDEEEYDDEDYEGEDYEGADNDE